MDAIEVLTSDAMAEVIRLARCYGEMVESDMSAENVFKAVQELEYLIEQAGSAC